MSSGFAPMLLRAFVIASPGAVWRSICMNGLLLKGLPPILRMAFIMAERGSPPYISFDAA
jgi:hypothetical protein